MNRDLRICFVGDSFVAGEGDPRALGWSGRLTAHARSAGLALTAYNLGIRGQTSADIAARWRVECRSRLPAGIAGRLVFSFGVNDTVRTGDGIRVDVDTSVANLRAVLAAARDESWPVLMAGPPPVDDAAHNRRIADLDERFDKVCAEFGVPYIGSCHRLAADSVWMEQVRSGDGAHPGAEGYAVLAELLLPRWREWLDY
ncbi:GDSL-type esterase/lipase family protein [Nocardia sp. NPDC051750]|uniref:GDSL-type esterase/lipase family protein n=1 Tax=Nocardia sp. NPDC051750 TaxID=3364325 RepID=UPI0037B6E600